MMLPLAEVKTKPSGSALIGFRFNSMTCSLGVRLMVLALFVLVDLRIPRLTLSPIQTVEQSSEICFHRSPIASPVRTPVPNKNST